MLTIVRTYLELAYFLSGTIVACAVVAGLRQITLTKRDIKLRSERAAKEKAIEYSLRYLTNYVAADHIFTTNYLREGFSPYQGPIGDFSKDSLPEELQESILRRYKLMTWLDGMNELLAISSAFTSGVADEKTGFGIIGRTFCATVEMHYDLIAFSRSKGIHDYFQPIVDLFQLWAPRLSKAELEEQRRIISEKLGSYRDGNLPFIGAE